MNKILPLTFLSLPFMQIAQPTITVANLPEAGYTYIVGNDTISSVLISNPSSVAQVWNFSSLLNHYQTAPSYDSTNKTIYQGNFPHSTHYTYGPAAMYSGLSGGAPVGTQGMNNGYMFWKINSAGFWTEGFRADNGTYANKNVYYSPQELLIGTPATLGSTFTNTARWFLLFNSNPADFDTLYVCHIEKSLTSDAFGTLTTPVSSYNNTLRTKEFRIKTDSAYISFLGNPVTSLELSRDTSINYYYIDNSLSYPVVTIYCNQSNVIKTIEYFIAKIPSTMAIEPKSNLNQLTIFPNPISKEQIENVNFNISDINNSLILITITDIFGNKVYEKNFISGTKNMTPSLNAGTYFLSLLSNDGNAYNGKIIITE